MCLPCFRRLVFCLVTILWLAGAAAGQDSPYDAAVQKDLQTAYAIAQSFFTDAPNGRLTLLDLQNYGFRNTEDVTIEVLDGRKGQLAITGEHPAGAGLYAVDREGRIVLRSQKGRFTTGVPRRR